MLAIKEDVDVVEGGELAEVAEVASVGDERGGGGGAWPSCPPRLSSRAPLARHRRETLLYPLPTAVDANSRGISSVDGSRCLRGRLLVRDAARLGSLISEWSI